jgi:hypothetical protein
LRSLPRLPQLALLLALAVPASKAQARPGFRPFKDTTIIATAGIERGLLGASITSEVGVVLRARSSPEPGGLFCQTGLGVGPVGARGVLGTCRALSGGEWNVGPTGTGHPIYSKRVTLSFAGFGIAAAKEGGLGVSLALPVPGWNFLTEGRIPISLYVANPGLCRVSGAVIDRIDRVTAAAGRLVAPITRPLGRAVQPAVRAVKRGFARLRSGFRSKADPR